VLPSETTTVASLRACAAVNTARTHSAAIIGSLYAAHTASHPAARPPSTSALGVIGVGATSTPSRSACEIRALWQYGHARSQPYIPKVRARRPSTRW